MTILMPWRDSGCPHRRKAKEFLTRHYGPIGPVITADSGHDPFHRAASRNLAARLTDADVLSFIDADAWLPLSTVTEAQQLARESGVLVKPEWGGYLTEEATARLLDAGHPVDTEFIHPPAYGFIGLAYFIRRDSFEALHGFDEGFVGYGGEDNAFHHVCEVLLGPARIASGTALSLWHPIARHTEQANRDRLQRFAAVRTWDDYRKVKV